MRKDSNLYYPSLDSVRAFAVILVIISHWFSSEHFLNRYTSNGTIGVTLFFVLSGFLITGILLNYKAQLEHNGTGLMHLMKNFYLRRSLRIFPIYYLTIVVILIFQFSMIKDGLWWHFFYLSNVYFWLQGTFNGSLSHFWSLAVEEQFYLIWPILILLLPWRRIHILLITGILYGLIFRLIYVNELNEMARFLLPGSLDSFCIGAIFAIAKKGSFPLAMGCIGNRNILLTGFFGCLVLSFICKELYLTPGLNSALFIFLLSCAFGFLIIVLCLEKKPNSKKSILQNPLLMYIGKISYGLYLYHNFIPFPYELNLSWLPISLSQYAAQLCRFFLLLLVATASWFLIEKPFLRLKNKYNK